MLPVWYAELIGARSFVMLPLLDDGKLLGLIYGDYTELHTIAPSQLAEGSMHEWREELIQALRMGN